MCDKWQTVAYFFTPEIYPSHQSLHLLGDAAKDKICTAAHARAVQLWYSVLYFIDCMDASISAFKNKFSS